MEIKIDINNVFRGALYQPITLRLCDKAQEIFGKYVKVEPLSSEDLYAGKFCAALDRQHPRDLFDVMVFFNKYEFTNKLKNAFLIYLLSASRPIIELLQPHYLTQEDLYKKELVSMTDEPIGYDKLVKAREKLVHLINKSLSGRDKDFLFVLNPVNLIGHYFL